LVGLASSRSVASRVQAPRCPAGATITATASGYQTGTVDRPADDEDNIGVDDGSGIIQGATELRRNKPKKKKVKDPNCREEKKNGYRVSNCW